jgi:L-ascorbate metabolism protein UlaG (beta-lactamase superfamily)
VELDEKVLIFDWFDGNRVEGYHFRGTLPEYETDTPVYVFASHSHRDHFDMDVLHLADRYSNIRFIFSKDCRMTRNFLKKHGFAEGITGRITYVAPAAKYKVDDLNIETFRSTDAGVAFYVECAGICVFHAGDLNDWKWDGAGDLINGNMQHAYRGQIKLLRNKKIHLAFLPMDPRLGEYQFLGIDYFLQHVDADYVFPMHMWQDYSGIAEYKRRITNQAMAERIVELYHENQQVPIQVE